MKPLSACLAVMSLVVFAACGSHRPTVQHPATRDRTTYAVPVVSLQQLGSTLAHQPDNRHRLNVLADQACKYYAQQAAAYHLDDRHAYRKIVGYYVQAASLWRGIEGYDTATGRYLHPIDGVNPIMNEHAHARGCKEYLN